MGITLYTAPDCIRCKIVKAFLAERGLAYDTIDFKADAQEFNTFYRTNRKAIYRNPEGVEFPLFSDGEVIKQGSGEIIAYLLSGHTLEACVTRSDMLHGKIAGLYPSQCPAGQEDNFAVLVDRLAAGGLQVWLQTDGRKPELLEKLLKTKDVHVVCNLVGGPEASTKIFGGAPSKEELAKTIALVQATPDGGALSGHAASRWRWLGLAQEGRCRSGGKTGGRGMRSAHHALQHHPRHGGYGVGHARARAPAGAEPAHVPLRLAPAPVQGRHR